MANDTNASLIDTLTNANCLEAMQQIADHSIDLILTDLPYGTTRNKWDTLIPLDRLWSEWRRIITPRGAIVLFAQCPFDKVLGNSNLPWLRYEWIWVKEQGTGHLNAPYAPMKQHETILVFSPAAASHTGKPTMIYNPQYRKGKAYRTKAHISTSRNYDHKHQRPVGTDNDGNHYYPLDVLRYSRDKDKLHPTQKPIALLRYLIRTYTDPDMTVLDCCAGSGSTCIAATQEHRHYIAFELDPDIYQMARKNIYNHTAQGTFFFPD